MCTKCACVCFLASCTVKVNEELSVRVLFTNLLKLLGSRSKRAVVSCPWDTCKPSDNTVLPLFEGNGIAGIIHTSQDKGTEKAKGALDSPLAQSNLLSNASGADGGLGGQSTNSGRRFGGPPASSNQKIARYFVFPKGSAQSQQRNLTFSSSS